MTHYDGLTSFPPPDADGLTWFEVPESEEEELIRLRAEVVRLREALINERITRIYALSSPDKAPGTARVRDLACAQLSAEGLLPE